MPDALGRVLSALRAAVPHLDPAVDGGAGPGGLDGTALAEALWLAAAMARDRPAPPPAPAPPPSAAPGGDAPAPRGADPQRPPRRPPERPHAPASSDAAAPPADARGLHERLPGAGTRLRGHAVAAPRATGLPRALEVTRALRPWKRPWPEGRRAALDIEATVEGYARSGELLPVFSAAPERWFDLTLVVDRSPNMRVWEETLDDFTAVLDRLGAFRTLRVRDLLFDGAGRPQAPGQLRQADGRRLVVVVSDCVSAPWRTSPVWRLLREWAATTPTALLNPLPAKLWRRGGLDLPTVRFTPAAPGAHRSRLPHAAPSLLGLPEPAGAPRGGTPAGGDADRREAGAWLPVPVLSLSPHSLDRWSRAAMRGAPEGCTAVLVPPGGRPPGRPRRRAVPLPPGTAAEGFLRTAAPRAVRLAVLCAPFDRLSLRLLHVIRRELVPDATTADVAEAVTSGLFELEQPSGGSGPLELLLPEEVRAVLQRRLPAHEAWRVHQALDRHVASLGDGRPGLRSVAYDASAPRELPAEQEAFARASRQTLELLGLAVPGEGAPVSGGDGEGRGPGASGVFPPPPERFVRREHAADSLLARLVDPAAGTVWVTAAGDGPGAGRTALALHVAHRFPGERHFVDMRGSGDHPVPPEAALHRLLSSLGASGGEEARSAEELAAALTEAVGGRRVLLVLDDVPEPARMERLLPSAPGCAVLATTRGDVPRGYRLASLSDHGAVELLAAWAGPREHGGHAALRELTAGRVRQPLTLRIVGSWIASGSAPSLPELSRLAHEVGPGAVRPFPEEDPTAVLLHLRLRALPDREREALRRFAFVPTGELTRTEAWALLGDDRAARAVLGRLAAAGLLDRRGAGVYRMPEEVRREVGREGGHEVAVEPYLRRLVSHHLTRAAALYEEDHPGSALAENLRVRAAGAADDPASRHVWLDNALVLAATAGVLPPERLADLLLLLHARGASAAHRSRFERAARAVIRVASGRSEGAVLRRSVAALALARYAAGAVADAAAALEGVAEEEWERDGALRGPVKRLAGQLATARGALAEAEGFLRRALDAFRADGDRFGTAAACLDLASVLVRLGRTDEVLPIVREALGCYADSVPHPLMRGALLALEDALAEAGRHRELLAVRRALLAQYETEGGDPCAEARLLIRIARTLIALGEHAEARGVALRALEQLDGPGTEADREEARRLLDVAFETDAGPPGPPVIVAVGTDGDHLATGEALSLTLVSLNGSGVPELSGHRLLIEEDRCLLFLPPGVPLDALLGGLAERLPDELEAAGRHPAARLAVHVGSTGGSGAEEAQSGLDVRLTAAMLGSPEFRAFSENFPFHPVLCVSPEAFGRLGPRDGAGLVAGRFVPREVTGTDGRVVCVVLAPHLDLSVYDTELLMLARLFNDLDPDGRAMATAVRESLDAVLDPEGTGRYDAVGLDDREKALIGPRLELALRRLFPAAPPFRLRLSLGGARGWASSSRAEHGDVCLVVRVHDAHARWSAGLLRVRPETAVAPVHRDAASPLAAEAWSAVLWLRRGAPLPENVLLRLSEADRAAVLAPGSAVDRTAELFRRVRERPVPEAALRAVTRRRDGARLVREAAAVLRGEGVLVVGGNRRGRELVGALRIPVPDADAYVSVRLTRRRPHHDGPSVLAGGVAWVVAGPDDPVEPLPQDLPPPRRPR